MLCEVTYTLQIGRNIIKAYKNIHAQGVYHGDVQPENILVRSDQSIVIIDFEMSDVMAPDKALRSEMKAVEGLLTWLQASSS